MIYCSRLAGLCWCYIALGLVAFVLTLFFRCLVFLDVSWMILMAAGLLRKVWVAVGWIMEVSVFESAGCVSGQPYSASCVPSGPN